MGLVTITLSTPSNHQPQRRPMKSPLEDILTISNKRLPMTYSYMQRAPRYIESQIIDYIMSLRNNQVSYATIQFLVAPIFTFYQLNDVILNRKKVSRYMGEYKRVVKDHTYTTEQIQQALQTADVRVRMVILLLSSTGARIGSLPSLTLGNLTKIPQYNLYKLVFYEGTNNEYYTFTTRECALTGIDNYLSYRERCGEKINI